MHAGKNIAYVTVVVKNPVSSNHDCCWVFFRRMWTVSSITPRTATALKSGCASRLNAAVGRATRAHRACATTPSTSTRPSQLTSSARCNSRAGLRANQILHPRVPSLEAVAAFDTFPALLLFIPPCPPRGRLCPLIPPLHEETCTPSFNSSIRKTLSIFPSFHTSFRRFSLSPFSFHLFVKSKPVHPLNSRSTYVPFTLRFWNACVWLFLFFVSCYLFCVYLRWCIIEFAVLYFCTFNYYSFSVLYYYCHKVLIVKCLGCVETR